MMEVDLETVEEWGGGLRVLHNRLRPYFVRSEARDQAIRYIQGLLSAIKRKNGWQLAEQAGEVTPDAMQRLLNRAVWSAEAVREALQAYILEHIAEGDGILVVDETGFLKQGSHSAGVKRQYSGTAGRVAKCQMGVFLAYASRQGHVLVEACGDVPFENCPCPRSGPMRVYGLRKPRFRLRLSLPRNQFWQRR